MLTAPVDGRLAALEFRGRWRRYQELALAAFEKDRAEGRTTTHIVSPPGSGKTLLGMEIIRRLGRPALVLVPNSAVQTAWLRASTQFTNADGVAAPDPAAPIAVLTYQSLCQLDDPAVLLGDLAARRWALERAAATGSAVEEIEREAAAWRGEAARRRVRELRRITAGLKREIARAEHGGLRLGDLLSAPARRRLAALRANGVGTLVLDECHHLASLWGYMVRTAVEELGEVHLIGLTATPPGELPRDEAELYEALLGPVDFTVPTPAVVRERHLAPYQELAWFTQPLDSESAWLAEHDLRFQELVTTLHDTAEAGPLSFPEWVVRRLRDRGRGRADEEAEVAWTSFQRRHPDLARAGARFLASADLPLPPGVPRGEGYRERPNLEDWLVLLEDYALRCLRASPSPEAAARHDLIAGALRDLGFNLTRQGIRRGASDVDRLLMISAAKAVALVDLVGAEYEVRGDGLRALVLTDTEQARSNGDDALLGVLRPQAGTAPEVVRALAGDPRTAPLRPLLVSGRGLRCAAEDAGALLEALREGAFGRDLDGWRAGPEQDGLVRLDARGPDWQPRVWVQLATDVFANGTSKALVGTRALLGEGWDSPRLNCLVDLSVATTSVSVTQMRGRSLRLDPRDPDKIASNWDVVCVAPDLTRGDADYRRFVRKHLHLFAPSEDGAIEAGPSHVHPSLSPFAPPPAAMFEEINRAMLRRAGEHDQARKRWRIGEPYRAEEHDTLLVRPSARPDRPTSATPLVRERPPRYTVDQRVPLQLSALGAIGSPVMAALAQAVTPLAGLALVPAGLGWTAARIRALRRLLPEVLPLDLCAHAVAEAYLELGELRPEAAASLSIEPRASGYLRCYLRSASPDENARFSHALDDVLNPEEFPRYLVSRLVADPAVGVPELLWRVLTRRPLFERRWVAVPADLGRNKERAETFNRAWTRWLGPSELLFTQRAEEGRSAAAQAASQAPDYSTATRRVWK